jgi:hypothetical protein
MSRQDRYIRKGLLDLLKHGQNDPVYFTARFLSIRNQRWITISQLCVCGSEKKIASHLNLPVHKISTGVQEIRNLSKGTLLFITASVGAYKTNGIMRGTLLGWGDDGLIDVSIREHN